MKKTVLINPVKKEVSFGSRSQILDDLNKCVGTRIISSIIHSGYFSINNFLHRDTVYKIPVVHISAFEEFFNEEAQDRDNQGKVKKLNKQVGSEREFVGLYKDLIIKSPKRGIIHPFTGEFPRDEKFSFEERAQMEYVNSNVLSHTLKKDVVRSLFVIESLTRNPTEKGNFYSVELYFEPLGNPNKSPQAQTAYENFLRYNEEKGFKYVPSNRDRPFEDLVVRRKIGGNLEVLATDWPHFVKA